MTVRYGAGDTTGSGALVKQRKRLEVVHFVINERIRLNALHLKI